MSLIAELKRRNVFRVVAAYVVLSWLLLQIGDIMFDALALPDWSIKMLVALLGLGLIPAVIFSWAYELTPGGVKKEADVDRSESVTSHTGRKLDLITIGMIVLGIGVVLVDRVALNRGTPDGSVPAVSDRGPAGQLPTTVPDAADDRSIAVLPFLNLSSDQEQEYFSDGLADTLLHRLAQLPDLRVAARTSSFKFKGHNEDMRDIARQLGVATVLEGSVQKSGNRVRITAQLIRGDDGSHIWSKVFDDTLDDIFRVQDEIAKSVADALTATWLGGSESQTTGTGTTRLAAYDAYLKGLKGLDQGTPEGASQALAQLELAVELDPDYALAWVALVDAYLGPATLGTATWESTYAPRMNAALKAVELAPDLAESQLALAGALRLQGSKPAEVMESVEKAVALAPNNAAALEALSEVRSQQGAMREALLLAERATLINPLDHNLQISLAYNRLSVGLVESALELGARLAADNPENLDLLMDYGDLLSFAGRPIDSLEVYKQALDRNPDLLRALFQMHHTLKDLGDFERADEYLRRVEVLSPNRALDDRAEACLVIGDRECHEEFASRYLLLQRESGAEASADLYEGVLEIYRGDFDKAIELLEPRLEEQILGSNLAFGLNSAPYLALAYDRIGRIEERDRLLDRAESKIRESLANGLWTRLAAVQLLELAAIRGDAGLAAERFASANDNEMPPASGMLEHYAIYDKVRDDPRFQEQLLRCKQREAVILQQLLERIL